MYLKTVKAPLETLYAVDTLPLRDAQKNVLYGVIDMALNSVNHITVKSLASHLNQYPMLTNRYLGDLLGHRCIFRIRHRSNLYIYFLNEDYQEWSTEWIPFK